MSEVIEALESKGLIKRSQHPSHRRVYPATLTAKGRKVLAACEQLVDEMEAEMLHGLNAAERNRLRESLIHAVRLLHAGLPE
jgi:DNA-binding MarR family transcriptional regulator